MKTILIIVALACLAPVSEASAAVQKFRNNLSGFITAAGPNLQVIDFLTQPNGSPVRGELVPITDDNNYDAWGVHFSGQFSDTPFTQTSFNVTATSGGRLTANIIPLGTATIVADLLVPVSAVAITSNGFTQLCAYGQNNVLIDCTSASAQMSFLSLGIVSDIPIYRASVSRNSTSELVNDFYYAPIVPEPASLSLVAIAALAFARRR